MLSNIETRVTKLEALYKKIMSEQNEILLNAYEKYAKDEDEERCAYILRMIRNNLLDETDKYCTLDRVLPETPDGNNIGDWINWLSILSNTVNGEWAIYRQKLRDLPQQEGFPLNVDIPEMPE